MLISHNRWKNNNVSIKYEKWEESQNEFEHALLSTRALSNGYSDHTMRLMYGDMEMNNNFIDHALNV